VLVRSSRRCLELALQLRVPKFHIMTHPYFDLSERETVVGPLGRLQFVIVLQLGISLLIFLPDAMPWPPIGYALTAAILIVVVMGISLYEKYAPKGYFDHLSCWLLQPRVYVVTRDQKQKKLIVKGKA
jgi:hypothetical protein